MSEINRTSSGAAPEAAAAPSQPPKHQPEHVKGPSVWLDMDQKQLDDAYDQSVWAPNREHVGKRRRLASERMVERVGEPERLAYGPTEIEKLDIYKTKQSNAPIHVFIHGGAWRGGLAKEFAFPAEMFMVAGAHYVAPDFVWVQDAGGN
ncbi:MAG: hypothetical protein ACREQ7_22000, partial [Candidatus Binatia bacterium]